MGSYDDLLALQEHDTAIDRLRAQRDKLPEREVLVARRSDVVALEGQIETLVADRDETARDEKRLDDTATAIRERMTEVEQTMYGGTVTSPRELQAMQAEIEQFQRQLRSLEDQELDVMERREGLEGEVNQLQEKLAGVRADVGRLEQVIADQEAEIDAQLDTETAARDALAPGLPADLLELYQDIRARNRGVGAARLVAGTCQACHLALPTMEVDRIKKLPSDELARCEQCGAILVRE